MSNCPVEYWIWLQNALGAGARTDELLSYFKTPEEILYSIKRIMAEYKNPRLFSDKIIENNQVSVMDMAVSDADTVAYMIQRSQQVVGMKYAIVIIASLPLLMLFPFAQKYFEKGTMVGSVKG